MTNPQQRQWDDAREQKDPPVQRPLDTGDVKEPAHETPDSMPVIEGDG